MAAPVILMGAGASMDAGLPDTFRLTKLIYDELCKPGNGKQAILFGYILSKIRARKVLAGGSPFAWVNVEEVYDTLLRIVNRDDDILSEFASGWDPIFEFMKPDFDEESFMRGISGSIADQSRSSYRETISINEGQLREAARSISRSLNRGSVADGWSVSSTYIDLLVRILSSPLSDTSYMDRIADFAGDARASVATLNYDMLFENSCVKQSVDFDCGLSRWNDRQLTEWRTGRVKLFKLHGSINWAGSANGIVVSDVPPEINRWQRSNAQLIFGGENGKLTPDGPFLQIRNDFERFLLKSNRLIVIGYSFGDRHVNSILRRWVSTRKRSKMIILNPARVNFGLDVFRDSYDGKARRKTVEIIHVKRSAAEGIERAIQECGSRFNSRFETGKGGFLPHILVKTID